MFEMSLQNSDGCLHRRLQAAHNASWSRNCADTVDADTMDADLMRVSKRSRGLSNRRAKQTQHAIAPSNGAFARNTWQPRQRCDVRALEHSIPPRPEMP